MWLIYLKFECANTFKIKGIDACDILNWKLSHFFSHEKVWVFDKDHNPSLKGFWNLNPLEIRTRWKTRIPSFEILNKLSQLIENDLDCPWATRNHPHCWFYRIFFGQPKNELHTLHGLQNKNSTIQGLVVARNDPHHPWQSKNDLHPFVGCFPKQSKMISIGLGVLTI